MQRDMLVKMFLSVSPLLSIAENMIAATVKRIARDNVRSDMCVPVPDLLDNSDLFHLRFDDTVKF